MIKSGAFDAFVPSHSPAGIEQRGQADATVAHHGMGDGGRHGADRGRDERGRHHSGVEPQPLARKARRDRRAAAARTVRAGRCGADLRRSSRPDDLGSVARPLAVSRLRAGPGFHRHGSAASATVRRLGAAAGTARTTDRHRHRARAVIRQPAGPALSGADAVEQRLLRGDRRWCAGRGRRGDARGGAAGRRECGLRLADGDHRQSRR